MKNLSKLVLASSLVLAASTAFAESVDFTVSGTISPSACVPTLSGNFEFGTINSTTLKLDTSYEGIKTVAAKDLYLNVACSAATSFALSATDNKAGTVSNNVAGQLPEAFGLGQANGKNIGGYLVGLRSAVGDSGPVKTFKATDDTATTWAVSYNLDARGNYTRFGLSADTYNSYSSILAALSVQPLFDADIDLSNEITLDGSATIEIKYL
ncbi:DUF1120 domain-containing protein [Dyella sp. M7H15-1]|uniref:DUF1120 domain-containing protein n=1 Tax=Dyella sp. M7H15-1 TaxID=2501295 RepID=UPI0013E8D32F|nr:DUF1120 domain-containing protein [Dyella sp. M7H15-1]